MIVLNLHTFLLFLVVALLSACTNKQIYEAVQQNQLFECQRLPQVQFADCMEGKGESYESYAKNREELINSKD